VIFGRISTHFAIISPDSIRSTGILKNLRKSLVSDQVSGTVTITCFSGIPAAVIALCYRVLHWQVISTGDQVVTARRLARVSREIAEIRRTA
jgi:hypothetical protein